MFDIGFLELVLLAGLGLIVLGPKRLPEVAAQLGRWVGQARRMSRTLMYQLRQEVNLDDPRPFSSRRPAEPTARKANSMHQEPKREEGETGSREKETEETGKSEETEKKGRSKPSE